MNCDLTEDQSLLVDSVREFVKKESPVERMRKLRDSELGWDRAVWKKMGELGWLGVMFPESVGGAAMTFVEAGLIVQELGTTLVPEPVIPLFVAGSALAEAGSAEQQQRFLAPSVAGEQGLAFAFLEEHSRHDPHSVRTHAHPAGAGSAQAAEAWVLNGTPPTRLWSRRSDGTRPADGPSLFVIDAACWVRVQPSAPWTARRSLIELARRGRGRSRGGVARPPLALMDLGAAATVCEASGILQTVLWMTRNYLMERKQFNVPIGSFQALQHRTVDMFVEAELTKSVAMLAMIKAQDPDPNERQRAISAAKASVIESGAFVTRQGIQLHGGIGVTDEHDVGLYFKRMHILATMFGDDAFHLARYASRRASARTSKNGGPRCVVDQANGIGIDASSLESLGFHVGA